MLKLVKSPHTAPEVAPQPPQAQAEYLIGIHSYNATSSEPYYCNYKLFKGGLQTYVIPTSGFKGCHNFAVHLHRRNCQLRWVQIYSYYPDDKYGDLPFSMDIPLEWEGCHVTLIKMETGLVLFITEHEMPTGTLILGYQQKNEDLRFISLRYPPPYAEMEPEPAPTGKRRRKPKAT